MASVVGEKFAQAASEYGFTVCLHRFCEINQQLKTLQATSNKENVFAAVGLNQYERFDALQNAGCENFLLDIANGTVPQVSEFIEFVSKNFKFKKFMIGNVHHENTFLWLKNCMNEFFSRDIQCLIRVGIGGGSPCSTSDMTGVNRGQITEIDSCAYLTNRRVKLIADGGISKPSFAAKAFGAGANYVMMGGYFAKADLAETHLNGDGTYWGGASEKQQRIYSESNKLKTSEGKVFKVEEVISFTKLADDLIGGLQSAISYAGYASLEDFIGNGVFEVKENSLPPKNRY